MDRTSGSFSKAKRGSGDSEGACFAVSRFFSNPCLLVVILGKGWEVGRDLSLLLSRTHYPMTITTNAGNPTTPR
eukprot:1366012-Amorphochlora_amoeboformis.AAC.2